MSDDILDPAAPAINTTHRWNHYCKAVSEEGEKCFMYTPHEGLHTTNHMKKRFNDEGKVIHE